MDVVLQKIHYNSECFSKIIDYFVFFVEYTKPGVFQKTFDNIKKDLICIK